MAIFLTSSLAAWYDKEVKYFNIFNMRVLKCDLCKKNIKDKPVTAGLGYYSVEMCEKCGAPIIAFLEKNKLFEKNAKNIWTKK